MTKEKITEIIVQKDSNEHYHSHQSISASGLKRIAEESVDDLINGKKIKETPAMKLGTAIHAKLIETDIYNELYYHMPYIENGRTKEGIALKKEALEKADGKIPLSFDEAEKVMGVYNRYKENDRAKKYCKGKIELSHYIKYDGVDVRVRPDIIGNNNEFIADIKTCQSSNPNKFRRDIYNRGYHIQAAFYMDMLGIDEFRFILCPTNPPYRIEVVKISDDKIEQGRLLWKAAFKDWKAYIKTGIVPGPSWEQTTDDGCLII